jgi:anti-sigma factor RsiW
MTCTDAGESLDAFVDGELAPSVSVEVARHIGQCARCDLTVQRFLAMREALVAASERALGGVDLSRVWTRVEDDIRRLDGQAAWRRRTAGRRRIPASVTWGAVAALAAGMVLFVRSTTTPPAPQVASKPAAAGVAHVAGRRLPNHVYIDRLAGKDIALRREPKSGTTMIWVNHEVESGGW